MNLYGGHHDYSLFLLDMGASDPALMESLYSSRSSRTGLIYGSRYYSDDAEYPASVSAENPRSISPPMHRHDGTSPLPLGMDWSPPPRVWDGRNTVWPHDYHSGWSYCVTVPFWTVTPGSSSSDVVVFYRVQVGVQSPDGITTVRGVLRRFSDFLKLFSELQKAFAKKKLPPAPSKHRLRSKSKDLLEDRRSLLEDWINMLLSDIDVSRSLAVATFLELEAAARLSFHEANQNALDGNSSVSSMVPSDRILITSDNSLASGISLASDFDGDSACEASELESPIVHVNNLGVGTDNTDVQEPVNLAKAVEVGVSRNVGVGTVENFGFGDHKKFSDIMENAKSHNKENTGASQETPLNENDTGHISGAESSDQASLTRKLSRDTLESEITSLTSNSDSSHAVSVVVPTEEQRKIEKILTNVQQKIATSKFDVKDLISRLDQELAVRQYLSTKVKDLELELETTKQNKEEMAQQAILMERERVTQMQWDIEEFRTKCLELEAKLKCEQEVKVFIESTKASIIQENQSLRQELDLAKDQVEKLLKQRGVSESKSKYDVKLLSREIRSLRNSQLELRQELDALIKEKAEMETILEEERKRRECVTSTNSKLLHECESLRSRFEECSIKYFMDEENKLTVETSFPSNAVDMLTTSDNRIGLLLAEAQLLAKDVEKATASSSSNAAGETDDDKLRKMVTDIFVDNGVLRKQINSALWYALKMPKKPDKDGAEETTSVIDTVLGKFLDR